MSKNVTDIETDVNSCKVELSRISSQIEVDERLKEAVVSLIDAGSLKSYLSLKLDL